MSSPTILIGFCCACNGPKWGLVRDQEGVPLDVSSFRVLGEPLNHLVLELSSGDSFTLREHYTKGGESELRLGGHRVIELVSDRCGPCVDAQATSKGVAFADLSQEEKARRRRASASVRDRQKKSGRRRRTDEDTIPLLPGMEDRDRDNVIPFSRANGQRGKPRHIKNAGLPPGARKAR